MFTILGLRCWCIINPFVEYDLDSAMMLNDLMNVLPIITTVIKSFVALEIDALPGK